MKTKKSKVYKYLVLVPHKDTRQILKKYGDELIKNGLKGVYPFPFAAPLAKLEKPLSPEELKKYAKDLRKEIGKEKFVFTAMDSVKFMNYKLYGVKFLAQRRKGAKAVVGIFFSSNKDLQLSDMPKISFRAAAVANFYIKQIPQGFKWKIGKLYWLPKQTRLLPQ